MSRRDHRTTRQSYPDSIGAYGLHTSTGQAAALNEEASHKQPVQPSPTGNVARSDPTQSLPTTFPETQQVTQHDAPRRRGPRAYEWLSTWIRKLERVRQILPISFDDASGALQEAGGPGKITTTKAVQEASDGKPSDGLLKNAKGKIRRVENLESEAKRYNEPPLNEAPTTTDGEAFNYLAYPVHTTAQAQGVDPSWCPSAQGRSLPSISKPEELLLDEHAQRRSSEHIHPRNHKRRISEDGAADGAPALGKHARRTSPRTSSAQIDSSTWVDNLARRTNKVSKEVIDHVVHHLSATFSSDSAKSIKDFLARRSSVRKSRTPTLNLEVSTLCERLSPAFTPNGASAADDIDQLIKASANVHDTTSAGETPLHLAVNVGYDAVCGVLLWAGADPYAKTAAGKTVHDNAEHALRGCGRFNDNTKLYSRILKCRNLVCFELEGVPPSKRHVSDELYKLCNRLDTNADRQAQRTRELKERRYRLQQAMPHREMTVEATLEPARPRQGDPSKGRLHSMAGGSTGQQLPSPTSVDSGFGGSPDGKVGPVSVFMSQARVPQILPTVPEPPVTPSYPGREYTDMPLDIDNCSQQSFTDWPTHDRLLGSASETRPPTSEPIGHAFGGGLYAASASALQPERQEPMLDGPYQLQAQGSATNAVNPTSRGHDNAAFGLALGTADHPGNAQESASIMPSNVYAATAPYLATDPGSGTHPYFADARSLVQDFSDETDARFQQPREERHTYVPLLSTPNALAQPVQLDRHVVDNVSYETWPSNPAPLPGQGDVQTRIAYFEAIRAQVDAEIHSLRSRV